MIDKDNDYVESQLAISIDKTAEYCYAMSRDKGFYDDPEHNRIPTKLMLMVTELTEAFESYRNNTHEKPSEHISNFTNLEEELADCIIRILDFAGWQNLELGRCIVEKIRFNATRPYKHNKQF